MNNTNFTTTQNIQKRQKREIFEIFLIVIRNVGDIALIGFKVIDKFLS